jgi:hypothetical protein
MSNFIQWDPTASNMETDAQYLADTLRSNGASNPSLLPSATFNKFAYQQSTFVAAMAQMLTSKGLAVTDSNLAALAGVLANIVITPDLAAYARLASPALTGNPTAPTQATADNDTSIATTAFVKAQPFVNQGGGAGQGTNEVYIGWDGTGVRVQVDATDFGDFALMSNLAPYATLANVASDLSAYALLSQFAFSPGSAGYQKLPSGMIMQWGEAASSATTFITVTFPIAFPNANLLVIGSGADNPGPSVDNFYGASTTTFNANSWTWSGGTMVRLARTISWFAIGF